MTVFTKSLDLSGDSTHPISAPIELPKLSLRPTELSYLHFTGSSACVLASFPTRSADRRPYIKAVSSITSCGKPCMISATDKTSLSMLG